MELYRKYSSQVEHLGQICLVNSSLLCIDSLRVWRNRTWTRTVTLALDSRISGLLPVHPLARYRLRGEFHFALPAMLMARCRGNRDQTDRLGTSGLQDFRQLRLAADRTLRSVWSADPPEPSGPIAFREMPGRFGKRKVPAAR